MDVLYIFIEKKLMGCSKFGFCFFFRLMENTQANIRNSYQNIEELFL